jgi:hypothetical protein
MEQITQKRAENMLPMYWSVSKNGYEWVGDRLCARSGPTQIRPYRMYPVHAEAEVFVKLAELDEPTPEDVLGFASAWGTLGGRNGDTLDKWQRASKELRTLITFRDDIRHKRIDKLKTVVEMRTHRHDDGRMVQSIQCNFSELDLTGSSGRVIASCEGRDKAWFQIAWNNYLISASEYLRLEVNKRLDAYPVTPKISWAVGRKPCMEFVPQNLLAILWLQFAQTITGSQTRIPCAGPDCPEWVYIGEKPAGRRRSKGKQAVTCGPRCRQNYCREQIHKAEALIREYPKKPESEMFRLLQAKGIAGGPWRGIDWVRWIRAGKPKRRKNMGSRTKTKEATR